MEKDKLRRGEINKPSKAGLLRAETPAKYSIYLQFLP